MTVKMAVYTPAVAYVWLAVGVGGGPIPFRTGLPSPKDRLQEVMLESGSVLCEPSNETVSGPFPPGGDADSAGTGGGSCTVIVSLVEAVAPAAVVTVSRAR